jgi:hypothetical protein
VNLGVALEKIAPWLMKQVYLFINFFYGKENHIIGQPKWLSCWCELP